MSVIAKFRKKPVVIEALQYTGLNSEQVIAWVGSDAVRDNTIDVSITTLEGTLHVSVGDWVIKGVQGEFYPCKPGIFEATYDSVEE